MPRRYLLKAAGVGMASLALAAVVPDFLLNDRVERIKKERLHYLPPERLSYPENSIIVGTSPDPNTPDYVDQFQDKLGITPGIVHHFIELGKHEIEPVVIKMQQNLDLGYLPMISFGPHKDRENSQNAMDEMVDLMGMLTGPVLIRPWFEANASWSRAWYGMNVEQYKSAWADLYEKCKKNMIDPQFVYAPNVSTLDAVGSVLRYTPHPEHFQFTGLDLYNKKSIYRTDGRYYGYDYFSAEIELGKDIYDFLHDARTADKPLIITEVNASVEMFRGGWMAEVYRYAVAHGACAVVSFDHNKDGIAWDETDWRLINDEGVIFHLSNEFENEYYYRGHVSPEYTLEIMKSQKLNQVLLPQAA